MSSNNNTLPAQTEVLIVGYGPVGATLAALLGRFGIDTTVIDKEYDILMMPRAIALDNEALRVLQMAGLTETAFERITIPEVKMHSPVMGQFAKANTAGSLNGHPKLVTFYQPDLEKALRKNVQSYAQVKFYGGHELQSFEQQDGQVQACIRNGQGESVHLACQYLIGADGARSTVRSLIGEDFQGQTYAEDWLVVDAFRRSGAGIDHIEFLCNPNRPIPHMPAPGGRERWEFMLKPGENSKQMESRERVEKLLAPWHQEGELEIERTAVYRFHARCCDHFSQGRVFLVGDAAHITPPFVGQGLVAGLRDVANLGWKLAWVIKGKGSENVLASYDDERRPHAKKMIDLARFMGHLIMTRSYLTAFLIHGISRLLRFIPPARKHFEELDIKPKNQFNSGLFVQSRAQPEFLPGTQFKQAWIRQGTEVKLSDDVLGNKLLVLGFAVDPQQLLREETLARWKKLGGQCYQVVSQGTRFNNENTLEDISNEFTQGICKGRLLVLRPDGFIMAQGLSTDADEVVESCIKLLAKNVRA